MSGASTASRGRQRPSVAVEEDLVHDVITVLDQITYAGGEGPHLDSRGRTVWLEDTDSINIEEIFDLGQRLRKILAQRELDKAVTAALASRGPALVTGTAVRR